MKRTHSFSCVQVLLILCSALLASCGGETVSPVDTQVLPVDPVVSEESAETESADIFESIRRELDQGVDYGDYNFTVLSYGDNGSWNLYISPEEENGEILNDAAFRRTTEVEDLLNIDVSQIADTDYIQKFKKSVTAGEGESYDLVCFWSPGDYSAMITGGLTYNWKDIPHIDLSRDYYNQTVNRIFTIAGKQNFAVSDFTYTVHQHFRILFNKELMRNLDLEEPYQAVYDGTWTFDRMLEYTRGVYADLDGDGKATMSDRYGMAINRAMSSVFPMWSGELPVSCDDSGFRFNLFSDRITSIVEKIVAFYDDPDFYVNADNNDQYQIFTAGNALFETYASDPAMLRDITFDYGYLPYPKFDDTQKEYCVIAAGGLMVFPSSAADIDRSGMIVEALSAASAAYLRDAFVEQYVENKVLRDEDSQRIYRMMRSLETYDLSYNIDPSGKIANYAYYGYFMQKKSADTASYYESIIQKIETKYADLFELVKEQE